MKVLDTTIYRTDKTDVKRVNEATSRACFKKSFEGSNTDSIISLKNSVAKNLVLKERYDEN